MARNRKNHAGGVRFAPAAKAVLLCLLIGGSGVGYVWQREQIEQLGRERVQREKLVEQLRRDNERAYAQLQQMRTVEYLKSQIRRLNLGLAETEPTRIWRLPEPIPPAVAAGETQYAAGDGEARTP